MKDCNVFLFVVDSLRCDVLLKLYNQKKLKRGFKYLIDNGFVCTNAYSNSNPTQFSFPTIFTSTLPLDYGGYDYGINNRPVSFVEILNKAGYSSYGFATSPFLTSLYGYNRGFTQYYDGFDLGSFIEHVINTIYYNFYIDLVLDHKIDISEASKIRKDFLFFFNPFIKKLINDRLNNALPTFFYEWQWNVEDLKKLQHDIEVFECNVLCNDELNLKKSLYPFYDGRNSNYQHYLGKEFLNFLFKYIGKKILRTLNLEYDKKKYYGRIQSAEIFKNFKRFFPIKGKSKIFQFFHLIDVHDFIFSNKNKRYQFHPKLFLSKYPDVRNAKYEASILWVDKTLGDYIDYIKHNSKVSPLFILISDHGNKFGYPNHGMDNISLIDEIYHDSLNVNMIFSGNNIQHQFLDSPVSLIDFAPSLLDIVNLKPDFTFKGVSVFSEEIKNKNRVIISETCGTGPCHIKHKPIYLSIKKDKYKMIYKEFLKDNNSNPVMELYDNADTYEQTNLIQNNDLKEIVIVMKNIAIERIKEIRKSF